MSINIGLKNNSYSLANVVQNTEKDKFSLNTFNHSNAIVLNADQDASSDVFINFRNKYYSGLKDNKYSVYDVRNTNMIVEMSSNVVFYKDVLIKDLIYTASNITVLNSNISCFLKRADDKISVYNANNAVVMQVDNNNTTIKNAKIQNTLYVDRIQNNFGTAIEIINPNIVGLVLQSFNIEEAISIKNVLSQSGTSPTLLINRYDNLANIIDIGTCNIYKPEVRRQFAIDRYGLVGIGPKQPEAPLHISSYIRSNPYIFKFDGENAGDIVNINQRGCIAIGTSNAKALLHIHRNDDMKDDMIRHEPLLRLNMQYDIASNISYNSNVTGILNRTNCSGMLVTNVNIQTSTNINTSNYYNNFNIINNEMHAKFNTLSYDTCNFDLHEVINRIEHVNANTAFTNIYRTINKIYYPSSLYAYEKSEGISYQLRDYIVENIIHSETTSNTYNIRKDHTYTHNILMMSRETYDYSGYVDTAGPKYNANRFINTTLYYSNINGLFVTVPNRIKNESSNYIHNIYFNINMLIENVNHRVDYKLATPAKLYEAPYFLYMSSNNDFKASLSSHGTLSLGSPEVSNLYYNPKKYVLYADGLCYMNKAEVNEIMTSNRSINFNSNNISNINVIYAQSNIVGYSQINNAYVSNLTVMNQFSSNICTCNLIVENVSASFMNMNKDNVHINTYLSVSKSFANAQTTDSTMAKIVVDNSLSSGNVYYKNYKGLTVTNEANASGTALYDRMNPSISVLGYDGSIPYVNISRDNTEYFIRINQRSIGSGVNTDIFEICSDSITGNTNRENFYTNSLTRLQRPSFINHIHKNNILTFGELHSICIDCTNNLTTQSTQNTDTAFTNATNKIAIGYPYGVLSDTGYNTDQWHLCFKNVIMDSSLNKYAPYMLNIFGYMGVYNINGDTLMTIEERIIDSINTPIMTVQGNVVCKYLDDTLGTSDSNIKTDLKIIENALDKVNTLTGYTFYNMLSSNQHSGLIAQEVQQVLPEVVRKGADDILRIDYANMMGLIVESIKGISKKLDNIDNRLNAIEDRGLKE